MDNEPETPENSENQDDWAHDQQKRSYYYDDAHGYEIYNPDEEDEVEEEVIND